MISDDRTGRNYSRLLWVFIGFILVTTAPAEAGVRSRLVKKVTNHLKKIDKIYPLRKWNKNLKKFEKELGRTKLKFELDPNRGLKEFSYKKLIRTKKRIRETNEYKVSLNYLIQKMKTDTVIKEVFPRGGRVKNAEEARARAYIHSRLVRGEEKRVKNKMIIIKRCDNIKEQFRELEAEWMLHYARRALFSTAKDQFVSYHFSDNAKALNQVTNRVDMYFQRASEDPEGSRKSLKYLLKKIPLPVKHLSELEAALSPELLYSAVVGKAAEEEIIFTMKAEQKIEAILKTLSDRNIQAVVKRIQRWHQLQKNIESGISRINQLIAKQERRKQRKKALKDYLSAMTTPEDAALIPDSLLKVAINKKTGKIKSSKVTSARKKLNVKVEGFSEELTKVDKFDFNNIKVADKSFKKISGETKESTSLYTYLAERGRADQSDLIKFVQEVGLLSFGGEGNFLSYNLPRKWRTGRKIRWQKDKGKEEEVSHNREFSYVELVVEAHKEHVETPHYEYVEKIYLPANMILIFDPGGKIKRFETFGDIRKVRINQNDLVRGNLYYKFLNYSVTGPEIELNGIDHEIKLAKSYK